MDSPITKLVEVRYYINIELKSTNLEAIRTGNMAAAILDAILNN